MMKKIIKKLVALFLVMSCLLLSSCGYTDQDELDDLLFDEYIEGLWEGEMFAKSEVFCTLYASVPTKIPLKSGQVSIQKNFKITLTELEDYQAKCTMSFTNHTLATLQKSNSIYFAMYGMEYIDGNYYDMAIFEDLSEFLLSTSSENDSSKSFSAVFDVYSLFDHIAIVVVTEGNIYAFKYKL